MGQNFEDLKSDFKMTVRGMPSRHNLGIINNIMGAFGFTTMVCGDQSVYTAASLEQMGYDARVINGVGKYGNSHSWIEVNIDGEWIEADPWDDGKIPSNNRKNYRVDGEPWDVQRGQADKILKEFRNRSGANSSLESKDNLYAELPENGERFNKPSLADLLAGKEINLDGVALASSSTLQGAKPGVKTEVIRTGLSA